MFRRLIMYLILMFGLFTLFNFYPVDYTYSDFRDYLTVLLTVSSMVFTLMGIWIALLYPNALQRLVVPSKFVNADISTTLSETKRLEGLVASVLKAAFVVTMIMLVYLGKIFLFKTDMYASYTVLFKSGAISMVAILSIIQLESIGYVIFSNVVFINELHSKREDHEAEADI